MSSRSVRESITGVAAIPTNTVFFAWARASFNGSRLSFNGGSDLPRRWWASSMNTIMLLYGLTPSQPLCSGFRGVSHAGTPSRSVFPRNTVFPAATVYRVDRSGPPGYRTPGCPGTGCPALENFPRRTCPFSSSVSFTLCTSPSSPLDGEDRRLRSGVSVRVVERQDHRVGLAHARPVDNEEAVDRRLGVLRVRRGEARRRRGTRQCRPIGEDGVLLPHHIQRARYALSPSRFPASLLGCRW